MNILMNRASIHETSHEKSSIILWSFSECCWCDCHMCSWKCLSPSFQPGSSGAGNCCWNVSSLGSSILSQWWYITHLSRYSLNILIWSWTSESERFPDCLRHWQYDSICMTRSAQCWSQPAAAQSSSIMEEETLQEMTSTWKINVFTHSSWNSRNCSRFWNSRTW